MKFKYGLLFLPLAFAQCNTAMAQAKAKYAQTTIKMGNIAWKKPSQAEFVVKNTGNQPLTINNARKDCGCTDVTWNPAPIAPGASAMIRVVFDAQTLGTFNKAVAIYTNGSTQPTELRIKGRVVNTDIPNRKEFSYQIGDLALSTNNIEFDDVRQGQQSQQTIYVYNGGQSDYMPEILHMPKYITTYAEPEIVRPGKVGKIHINLNGNELPGIGLTQTNIYLARFSGDHVGRDNEIGLSTMVLPQETFTAEQRAVAPVAVIDTLVDLGYFGKKDILKGEIELANVGKSPLQVNLVQVFNPGIGVSISKSNIKSGDKAKVKITISTHSATMKGSQRFVLLTNDPDRPKIVVTITTKK